MARWKPKEFSQNLREAVDAYDRKEAEDLCDKLIVHLRTRVENYPEKAAKDDLSTLRRKCFFDLMLQVGDAFIRSGMESPQIRRQYAQALLDEGNVSAGLAILYPIVHETGVPPRELAEAQGLIGRAYKQIYMDAGDSRPPKNRNALHKAISSYLEVYQSDKERFLWQGVNAVSLLKRAQRDGIDIVNFPDPNDVAQEITTQVEDLKRSRTTSMWDLATAAEAYLALGEWKTAADWLKHYVEDKNADAFELASTLRQFKDVIQLDLEEGEERFLIDLLQSQLLLRNGSELRHSPSLLQQRASKSDEAMTGLERVLGEAVYKPHQWLLTAFQRAQAVGRVWRGGKGWGSGFLIPKASLINPDWEDHQVFLTNSHVISNSPTDYRTLHPEQAEITFDALHGGGTDQPRYNVDWFWESPVEELDTTILKLNKEVEKVPDYPVNPELPPIEEKNRIYVIGHPKGGELSYSLQDNQLLAFNDKRIHYRSPTDPGSSGSPLYNDDWEIVGIHHGGHEDMPKLDNPDETYPANEGIPIKAIISAAKKKH